MAKREPKSPYQRKKKRPHRYSDAYRNWHAAAKGGKSNMLQLGREHWAYVRAVHGPMLKPQRRIIVMEVPDGAAA